VRIIGRLITPKVMTVIFLFILLPCTSIISKAQTDAEETLYVVGDIPPIKIGEDAKINLVFEDHAGYNYTYMIESFGWFVVNVLWPIEFGLILGGFNRTYYEEFKNYNCLHSIEFYAYIENNISGWHAIVEPSLITGSTAGHKANLTLLVRVDGMTSYPEANVIIKVVRKGRGGAILGVSYHKIPVKAEHIYLLDIRPQKSVINMSPGDSVTIPVEITNKGNYIETYKLVVESNGVSLGLIGEQILTINPGETRKINIQIYAPYTLLDLGTAKKIEIKAYPIGSSDVVFTAGVSIFSRGINLLSLPVVVMFIVVLVLIAYLFTGRERSYLIRPKKEREKYLGEKVKGSLFVERRVDKFKPETMKEEAEKKKTRQVRRKARDIDRIIAKIQKEQEKQRRKLQKL